MSYRLVITVGVNGATVEAWAVSRFVDASVPAENASPPSGSPDATATSSTVGAAGQAVLDVPSAVAYNIRCISGGTSFWTQTSEAMSAAGVSAASAVAAETARAEAAEATKVDTAGSGLVKTGTTLGMPAVGSPGSTGDASHTLTITVDAQGRVTSVTTNGISITHAAVTDWASAVAAAIPNVGTAGTAGDASHTLTVTTDAQGRVTSISSSAIAISESQVTGLLADLAAKALASDLTSEISRAQAAEALRSMGLAPTTVKTSNYSAAANELVLCDTTSSAITVTMPTAPANGTRLAAKALAIGGTNYVTFAAGGTDVVNKSGTTSGTLKVPFQAVSLQYQDAAHTGLGFGVWYIVADDLPLAQLDTRFDAAGAAAAAITTAEGYADTKVATEATARSSADAANLATAEAYADASAAAAAAAALDTRGTKGATATVGGLSSTSEIVGVIGDSTGRGTGSTWGSTDWLTDLLKTENKANGLVWQGVGFVPCKNGIDGIAWNNTSQGTAPSTIPTHGPTVNTNCSLKLASSGKSISDNRAFRRIKVYYQTVDNGDALTITPAGGGTPATVDTNCQVASVTLSTTTTVTQAGGFPNVQVGDIATVSSGTGTIPAGTTVVKIEGTNLILSAATTAGTATLAFSGYRMWDSGDLGSLAGTGITAAWATHTSGAGGGGAHVIGSCNFVTAGTNGVIGHNLAVGGTWAYSWAGSTAAGQEGWGWTEWLQMHVNLGTPVKRLLVVMGLNDLGVYSSANYATAMANVATAVQAVSPLTEVVYVAQWFGDQVSQFSSNGTPTGTPNVVTTNGSPIIYSKSGAFINPNFGAFPTTPYVGSTIGGPGIPNGTLVNAVAGPASAGALGPIAGTVSGGTTFTATSGTPFTNANGWYNGMAVEGTGLTGLVTITIVSSTVITLSAAATNGATSITGYGAITMSANATASASIIAQSTLARGTPANWVANWVAVIAQTAARYGATFINLYERFGDISGRGYAYATTVSGSSQVSCSNGFPNAAAGMVLQGPGIAQGTTILSVGSTTIEISIPATANSSTAGLVYGYDTWGISSQALGLVHLGDSSQSSSGRDGQKSMAGAIWDHLGAIHAPVVAGGSDTSLLANGATTLNVGGTLAQTFSSGTAKQVNLYSDATLVIAVTSTSGSIAVSLGPVTGAENPLIASYVITARHTITIPVPKGYFVKITYPSATIACTALPG